MSRREREEDEGAAAPAHPPNEAVAAAIALLQQHGLAVSPVVSNRGRGGGRGGRGRGGAVVTGTPVPPSGYTGASAPAPVVAPEVPSVAPDELLPQQQQALPAQMLAAGPPVNVVAPPATAAPDTVSAQPPPQTAQQPDQGLALVAAAARPQLPPGIHVPEYNVTHYANGRAIRTLNWVFTLWDRVERPEDGIGPPPFSYLCARGETGLRTRNAHWQGYMELPPPAEGSTLPSAMQVRAMMGAFGWDLTHLYLRPRWGTQQEAINYTMKTDTADPERSRGWHEVGTRRAQDAVGSRRSAQEAILDGATERYMIENHTAEYLRSASGIRQAIITLRTAPEWRDVKVFVFWGKTGTGKTRLARKLCREFQGGREGYRKTLGTRGPLQWDSYEDEEAIIIDEFKDETYPITALLEDLDGHPLKRAKLYGQIIAMWRLVFITTNQNPADWYRNAAHEHRQALYRRAPRDRWFNFTDSGVHDTFEKWFMRNIMGYDSLPNEASTPIPPLAS